MMLFSSRLVIGLRLDRVIRMTYLVIAPAAVVALSPLIFVPVNDVHPLGAFVICCAALSLIILMQVKVKP